MNLENFDALQQRFEFVRQNYHRLCRFCLDTKNLLTIFYQADPITETTAASWEESAPEWVYNDERNIGGLLQKQYVQFNPEDEYGLPNNICERCVDSLVQWNRFQENFIANTKLLLKVRDHLEPNGIEDGTNRESDPDDDDEHYLEEDQEETEVTRSNEVYEIEILQNLPENVVLENVTIIETLNGTETLEEETEKKFIPLPQSDTEQKLKELVIEREDLGSESSVASEKNVIQQRRRKRRIKVKLESEESVAKSSLKQRSEQCPICGMIVKTKMKHHMLRHSDPSGQPFKCPDCDKSYSFKRTLTDHIRQVHQHVRYGCDLCGKEFVSRDVLRIHKKLHTKEEHQCHICYQVFQQRMYLRKHMAVHDLKKFNCDDCGKIFRFKEQLKQHMRVHTGEKPFGCEMCTKTFRTSSHLKQHMRTHTQEKVFKCKRCPVEYANKKSLERHVAGAHPVGEGE